MFISTLSPSAQSQSSPPSIFQSHQSMKQVASVILGGGEGTRLFPLTLSRCKPAIRFGGKYRLIDIPISNSLHADCYKVFVLTQFLSSSLHRHIFQTYMQGGRSTAPIEILAAEQKPLHRHWYQGTADAVRQNIEYLLESPVDYFLILSGDQLYNINFEEMLQFAKKSDADTVIAALPITPQEATRMGILKVNSESFITTFHEKPQDPSLLETLRSSDEVIRQAGLSLSDKRRHLGSMGIYLFKREVLEKILMHDSREDFGKHLIPSLVETGKTAAYLYDGYWEDIGTIGTFHHANIALTKPHPPFSLHHETRPLFTSRNDLPPAHLLNTRLQQSIVCEGAIVEAEELSHSILGNRSIIHQGTIIRDSYLMGNDYYEAPVRSHHRVPRHPHIGKDCVITHAIIDKNAVVGNGVKLINKDKLTHYDGHQIFIRDGVIIVPRGATIPDGFSL